MNSSIRDMPVRAMVKRALCAACVVCLAALSAGAWADSDRRILLDRSLEAHPIRLISISDEALIYEDEMGRRRQATVGGFVALLPALPDDVAPTRLPGPGAIDDETGVLELTDGQRLPGRPAPTGGEGDALVWSHPLFGRISAPIDSIARIALRGGGDASLPAATRRDDGPVEDQLVLVNGDRLSGFVITMSDPVEFEVNGAIITIPLDRIQEATLANPRAPLSGMVVWLEDGSVAVVASVETRMERGVRVRLPGGQEATTPMEDIRAVAFDAGRLLPLAYLTPGSQRALGERLFFEPMRAVEQPSRQYAADLNAPDIELPGPMAVRWDLPSGVVRFAGVAEIPLEALPWGDCELVVSIDGHEMLRERLNQNTARIEFSLPVSGRGLTIAVEPGAYGPINDRVILRRPLLLTD